MLGAKYSVVQAQDPAMRCSQHPESANQSWPEAETTSDHR